MLERNRIYPSIEQERRFGRKEENISAICVVRMASGVILLHCIAMKGGKFVYLPHGSAWARAPPLF
jgi:hypothetical protein